MRETSRRLCAIDRGLYARPKPSRSAESRSARPAQSSAKASAERLPVELALDSVCGHAELLQLREDGFEEARGRLGAGLACLGRIPLRHARPADVHEALGRTRHRLAQQ